MTVTQEKLNSNLNFDKVIDVFAEKDIWKIQCSLYVKSCCIKHSCILHLKSVKKKKTCTVLMKETH